MFEISRILRHNKKILYGFMVNQWPRAKCFNEWMDEQTTGLIKVHKILQKIQNNQFSWLYLESSWEMNSNKYKHAWCWLRNVWNFKNFETQKKRFCMDWWTNQWPLAKCFNEWMDEQSEPEGGKTILTDSLINDFPVLILLVLLATAAVG